MRFGVCAGLDQVTIVQEAGYDYYEPGVANTLLPETPDEAALPPLRAALAVSELRPEAFNYFLSGDVRVTGPGRDPERLRAWLASACARAAAVGGKVLVFGSAGARNVPEGYAAKQAWLEIRGFLQDASVAAQAHGIEIAIEPLNSGESNILNSVNEGLDMVNDVNRPESIGVLADLYHIQKDGESFDGTLQAARRGMLRHVHVACGLDRHAPRETDIAELAAFFAVLKSGGYNERISIESGWSDFASEAASALAVMRRAWEQAEAA